MFGQYRREQKLLWKRFVGAYAALVKKIKNSMTVDDILKALDQFYFSPTVQKAIQGAYMKMATFRRMDGAKSWRQAATKFGNSKQILEGLKNQMSGPVGEKINWLISQNVQYIKTLNRTWAERATKLAQDAYLKGLRPQQVLKQLQKEVPTFMQTNLKTIARTQVAKANAAITQTRAQKIGINCYIWRTCKDQRVRSSHAHMEGALIFYNNPPSPEQMVNQKKYGYYHAGCIFNCRCYQQPVVKLKWLPDTVKVYQGGSSLSTMSRAQVMQRYGSWTR